MSNGKVYLGSEVKINIHILPIQNYSMADYDWFIELFTKSNSIIKKQKGECIRRDNDNYIVTLDTNDFGDGVLRYKLTAFIPDPDFNDGFRTEVVSGLMGVSILKSI